MSSATNLSSSCIYDTNSSLTTMGSHIFLHVPWLMANIDIVQTCACLKETWFARRKFITKK